MDQYENYQSVSARILRENMSGKVVWTPENGWHEEEWTIRDHYLFGENGYYQDRID